MGTSGSPRRSMTRSRREVLLDTSILIGEEGPGDVEAAIRAASLAALHFGVLVAADEAERARRTRRLGIIESVR